ncbi:MAG: hypothetical protein AAB582_00165 [Patescibacteria group bacterium]
MEHSPRWHREIKKAPQEQFKVEPIGSHYVQRALILMMDPADPHRAAELWTNEDVGGESLAKRYRDYVELPVNKDRVVDLSDEAGVTRLFQEITGPTVH